MISEFSRDRACKIMVLMIEGSMSAIRQPHLISIAGMHTHTRLHYSGKPVLDTRRFPTELQLLFLVHKVLPGRIPDCLQGCLSPFGSVCLSVCQHNQASRADTLWVPLIKYKKDHLEVGRKPTCSYTIAPWNRISQRLLRL